MELLVLGLQKQLCLVCDPAFVPAHDWQCKESCATPVDGLKVAVLVVFRCVVVVPRLNC